MAIVGHPESSQESVKRKSLFTFTFTLYTIYKVNVTAQYLKNYSPAADNEAIFTALLQDQEDNLSKMTDESRSKIHHNKSVHKKWYILSLQE